MLQGLSEARCRFPNRVQGRSVPLLLKNRSRVIDERLARFITHHNLVLRLDHTVEHRGGSFRNRSASAPHRLLQGVVLTPRRSLSAVELVKGFLGSQHLLLLRLLNWLNGRLAGRDNQGGATLHILREGTIALLFLFEASQRED